jgi:hypothetical protein
LLEDVAEVSEARHQILSLLADHGDSLNIYPLSVLVRVLPRIEMLPRILELAQTPDAFVSANAFAALAHLFEHNMPRLLALGADVITEFTNLLLQAESPAQLEALAVFAENLPAAIRRDLAGQLIAIGQANPTVNGLRCAAVADLFPAETTDAAPPSPRLR